MPDKPTLVLIHTVSPLVAVFNALCAEIVPDARLLHILDEPLLERIRGRGGLLPEDAARLDQHVAAAESVGACAVLVTCSAVSPAVDDLQPRAFPIFKIDSAMVAEAVRLGSTIGVLATNPTTLQPTQSLLQAAAGAAGKNIQVELRLVEGALQALMRADAPAHDRLVLDALSELAPRADVVVLAQASMARVLDGLPPGRAALPVLSSPHLALAQVKQYLDSLQ